MVVKSDDRSFQECQILKYHRLYRSTYQDSHCAAVTYALRFTYNPFASLPRLPSSIILVRPFLPCFLLHFTAHRYFISFRIFLGEYFGARAENQVTRISYLAIFFRRLLALSGLAPFMKSRITRMPQRVQCIHESYAWILNRNTLHWSLW